MDIAYLALMIPFAGIALGAFAIWTHHQREVLDKQATISAEKAAQYVAQTERLEQRVRVLERIVTDKGLDISAQIEDLRDDDETPKLN